MNVVFLFTFFTNQLNRSQQTHVAHEFGIEYENSEHSFRKILAQAHHKIKGSKSSSSRNLGHKKLCRKFSIKLLSTLHVWVDPLLKSIRAGHAFKYILTDNTANIRNSIKYQYTKKFTFFLCVCVWPQITYPVTFSKLVFGLVDNLIAQFMYTNTEFNLFCVVWRNKKYCQQTTWKTLRLFQRKRLKDKRWNSWIRCCCFKSFSQWKIDNIWDCVSCVCMCMYLVNAINLIS